MAKKAALGKGLGALIENANETKKTHNDMFDEVEVNLIEANPFQPRTVFEEQALEELADSIAKIGVISPITLRKQGDKYQIIAGERRFRASKKAGLEKIPAYIRKAGDDSMLEMALVENIQREDLDAIEIALSYQRLMDEFDLTQDVVSKRVGKKRATIANYLRLLKLPAEIQLGIRDRKIQMGHARAILGIEEPPTQLMVYEQILEYDFSVRKVEEIVRELNEESKEEPQPEPVPRKKLPAEYKALKNHLSSFFGVKVSFSRDEKGEGRITIPFTSDEELERIISILDKLQ
ncbi:ParB/RepB/Spo0J family partition protein [Saccharicrinis sp. FJH2]|uniref:ParB/RepB/Spo0J family partition protein n=1 Tax=unclassified Saccharicrinis TaxID=2646859 RepID=UPI0035D5099D